MTWQLSFPGESSPRENKVQASAFCGLILEVMLSLLQFPTGHKSSQFSVGGEVEGYGYQPYCRLATTRIGQNENFDFRPWGGHLVRNSNQRVKEEGTKPTTGIKTREEETVQYILPLLGRADHQRPSTHHRECRQEGDYGGRGSEAMGPGTTDAAHLGSSEQREEAVGCQGHEKCSHLQAASCCNIWDMQGRWEGLQMAMYHHPGLSLWFSFHQRKQINSYISSTHRLEFQFPFLCSTCQATFPFLL